MDCYPDDPMDPPAVNAKDDATYDFPLGPPNPANPVAFLTVALGGQTVGTIEIELKHDVVPKTAENFRVLCTGEKGFGYRGVPFHRIITGFMCQGGDITRWAGGAGVPL